MTSQFQSTIKYLMFGGDKPVIGNPGELLNDMKRHCIVPLFGLNDPRSLADFSEQDCALIKSRVFSQIRLCSNVLQEQNALYELLAAIGTKPVILKGFSAAKYYRDPVLRTTGDIDFFARGACSVEEVADFLSDHGYEVEDYRTSTYERHIGAHKNGVRFELHRHFSDKKNSCDDALDGIIEAAEPVECQL